MCPASLRTMQEVGADQRALFRRWPAGVSVVVAEVDGRRAGLTVSSLVSLSLERGQAATSLVHVNRTYSAL